MKLSPYPTQWPETSTNAGVYGGGGPSIATPLLLSVIPFSEQWQQCVPLAIWFATNQVNHVSGMCGLIAVLNYCPLLL